MYELKKIKQYKGRETPGFSAEIFRDGKFIGNVVDAGNGGCYSIYMQRDDREQFRKDVEEWQKLRNRPDVLEPYDRFLDELFDLFRMRKQARRQSQRVKEPFPPGGWYARLERKTDGSFELSDTIVYIRSCVTAGPEFIKL